MPAADHPGVHVKLTEKMFNYSQERKLVKNVRIFGRLLKFVYSSEYTQQTVGVLYIIHPHIPHSFNINSRSLSKSNLSEKTDGLAVAGGRRAKIACSNSWLWGDALKSRPTVISKSRGL